eukprot:552395-Prorocentrum_minimum.AAC.1
MRGSTLGQFKPSTSPCRPGPHRHRPWQHSWSVSPADPCGPPSHPLRTPIEAHSNPLRTLCGPPADPLRTPVPRPFRYPRTP